MKITAYDVVLVSRTVEKIELFNDVTRGIKLSKCLDGFYYVTKNDEKLLTTNNIENAVNCFNAGTWGWPED